MGRPDVGDVAAGLEPVSNAGRPPPDGVAFEAILGGRPATSRSSSSSSTPLAAGDEQNPGNFERLFSVRGGAQEQRFAGGSELSRSVARQLGRRVMLRSPVRRIVQASGAVVRVEADGMRRRRPRRRGRPAALAGADRLEPGAAGPVRTGLIQRMPMGGMMKVEAVYDRPFWRDEGLNGQAVSDTGPPGRDFDNSPPDGSRGC